MASWGSSSMTILALETTSSFGSVAIGRDGKLLALSCMDIQVTHSERVMPEIDRLCKTLDIEMKDFDCVAVSNGPGSFTGVRIGLATAKGIAMSLEIPLVPVNTLELLAANAFGSDRAVMPLIDARMNEVYGALYGRGGEILLEPQCSKPEEFLGQIDRPVVALGSGLDQFGSLLDELKIDYIPAPLHLRYPVASGLITLIDRMDTPIYDFDTIGTLEPYYLRKSQAELAHERNNTME